MEVGKLGLGEHRGRGCNSWTMAAFFSLAYRAGFESPVVDLSVFKRKFEV